MDRPHNSVGLGVFEALPYIPGGPGGEMKCPTCTENTPDAWRPLWVINDDNSRTHGLRRGHTGLTQVTADWMHCANKKCEELVIRVHQTTHVPGSEATTISWYACPHYAQRPIDPLVVGNYRQDYEEAAAILDLSPRMSAVLSRRILADLLEEYAKLTDFSLKARIDAFVADTSHPHQLRQNLAYLVEMGNFGAHTQKNDQAEIVDVAQVEAAWTLDLVSRLFDYFIVSPERDRQMREMFDKKLREAKRKPIEPPPEGESS